MTLLPEDSYKHGAHLAHTSHIHNRGGTIVKIKMGPHMVLGFARIEQLVVCTPWPPLCPFHDQWANCRLLSR